MAAIPAAAPEAKKDAAIVGREADNLAEEGTERRAGLDDRTFRAERAAGSDGERGGERLKQSDAKPHAAVAEENRFHGFRYAVAFEGRLPEMDHDADQQAADGRNQDDPQPKVVVRRIAVGEGESSVKKMFVKS